jgi:hypothetical protein
MFTLLDNNQSYTLTNEGHRKKTYKKKREFCSFEIIEKMQRNIYLHGQTQKKEQINNEENVS